MSNDKLAQARAKCAAVAIHMADRDDVRAAASLRAGLKLLEELQSELAAHEAEKQAGSVALGYMNAGHLHEMQQGRLPYGYVYAEEGPGAHVAVFLAPPSESAQAEQAGPAAAQDAAPAHSIPAGWLFKRNADGSIAIWGPPPLPGESQRTNDVVYANTNRDLHELLGRLADHQAATPSSLAAESHAVVAGIVERIEAALQRIEDGHGIRRIPADPTDPDLVLAECKAFFEGRNAPFLVKPPVQNTAPPSEKQAGPVALPRSIDLPEDWRDRATDSALALADPEIWARARTAPPSPLAEQDKEDAELLRTATQALACMRGLQQHLGSDVCSVEADSLDRAIRAARAKKDPQ